MQKSISPPDHNAAIITAGGIGRRMGANKPKQFISLAGRPIIIHTLQRFIDSKQFQQIILVLPADHLDYTAKLLQTYNIIECQITAGGESRQDSVAAGMRCLDERIKYVAVHDGVRPLVSIETINQCMQAAHQNHAAITAIPVNDTIKLTQKHIVSQTLPRDNLWRAQTPQAFKVSLLQKAYQYAKETNFTGTDESSLLEHAGIAVSIVQGSETNIKITRPEDIPMAQAFMTENQDRVTNPTFRIGHGYDAHQLIEGRALILGGVKIPYKMGLLGHSDADVLTHALCDAILGAIGAGDIGKHFPDSNPEYKGIDSQKLLAHVIALAQGKGLQLGNADMTIIAQQPKLASHLPQMRTNLAQTCKVEEDYINIKATTTEEMGFTGREEGIASHAVVMMVANY